MIVATTSIRGPVNAGTFDYFNNGGWRSFAMAGHATIVVAEMARATMRIVLILEASIRGRMVFHSSARQRIGCLS
jgi:hypothetical protein